MLWIIQFVVKNLIETFAIKNVLKITRKYIMSNKDLLLNLSLIINDELIQKLPKEMKYGDVLQEVSTLTLGLASTMIFSVSKAFLKEDEIKLGIESLIPILNSLFSGMLSSLLGNTPVLKKSKIILN